MKANESNVLVGNKIFLIGKQMVLSGDLSKHWNIWFRDSRLSLQILQIKCAALDSVLTISSHFKKKSAVDAFMKHLNPNPYHSVSLTHYPIKEQRLKSKLAQSQKQF